MNLIDTHCHLAHKRLRKETDQILGKARRAGVRAVICAAGDLEESHGAVAVASQHGVVFCTAGVHPHESARAAEDYLAQLERLAAEAKNVAVGEIGLDYHYDFSPRDDQRRVFAEQLQLAVALDKPVVIHTREAFDDTMTILSGSGISGERVDFHSFTGDRSQARRVLDWGATISFSGIVTFKRSDELRMAAAMVPDDKLLIETDSPYLSPEPVRKIRTNEPANVAHVADHLADVRKTSPEALAELTTANAVRFFHLTVD